MADVCTVMQPAEISQLGDTLVMLWHLTIFGLVLIQLVGFDWEHRIRRFLRRRRLRAIRARKAAVHG